MKEKMCPAEVAVPTGLLKGGMASAVGLTFWQEKSNQRPMFYQ
jgi:hypothetical protein